jgi:hypothetical protein
MQRQGLQEAFTHCADANPIHIVVEKPGILLHEIQNQLLEVLLLEVDVSTICRFLHESDFTRQKLHYITPQRDDYLRQKFICDNIMSIYEPHMLIFLDETGTDRSSLLSTVYEVDQRRSTHSWYSGALRTGTAKF